MLGFSLKMEDDVHAMELNEEDVVVVVVGPP
jgi:hypothetical protein